MIQKFVEIARYKSLFQEGQEISLVIYAVSFFIVIGGAEVQHALTISILRSFCGLLIFFLVIQNQWRLKYKTLFIFYWFFCLIYMLPFVNTLALLTSNFNSVWMFNVSAAVILLIIWTDIITGIVLLVLGVFSALMVYYKVLGGLTEVSRIIYNVPIEVLITYLILLFTIGTICHQRKINSEILIEKMSDKLGIHDATLREALKIRNEILNNFNHEIRTPLQGVVGLISALTYWQILKEEKKERLIKVAQVSILRLTKFVDNITKIVQDKGEQLTYSDFNTHDLSEVLDNLYTYYYGICLKLRSKGKNLNFIIKIKNENLNYKIICDKRQILDLLENIIDNSVKYSVTGDIIVSISWDKLFVTSTDSIDAVKISISDQGVGIPREQLVEIFEPFKQSSITKTQAGGGGVGLSACAAIVKSHNGKIWVESKINKGSTFFILLPYSPYAEYTSCLEKKQSTLNLITVDNNVLRLLNLNFKNFKICLLKTLKIDNDIEILDFVLDCDKVQAIFVYSKDITYTNNLRSNISTYKSLNHIQIIDI